VSFDFDYLFSAHVTAQTKIAFFYVLSIFVKTVRDVEFLDGCRAVFIEFHLE